MDGVRGRTRVAVFVMFAGVGIIGRLGSILASLLVSPAAMMSGGGGSLVPGGIDAELAQTRAEMAQTRAEMADLRRQIGAVSVPLPAGEAAAPGG